jgi:hypothetical protein
MHEDWPYLAHARQRSGWGFLHLVGLGVDPSMVVPLAGISVHRSSCMALMHDDIDMQSGAVPALQLSLRWTSPGAIHTSWVWAHTMAPLLCMTCARGSPRPSWPAQQTLASTPTLCGRCGHAHQSALSRLCFEAAASFPGWLGRRTYKRMPHTGSSTVIATLFIVCSLHGRRWALMASTADTGKHSDPVWKVGACAAVSSVFPNRLEV